MATISITVDDAQAQRVMDAFTNKFGGFPSSGLTPAQWVKAKIAEWVKAQVKDYEQALASNQAAANVDSQVQVT